MKFDLNSINKYFSAQAMGDFNDFIESLPMRAGYGVLIAGGIAWLVAGLAIVYATTVSTKVSDIRAELIKTEALKPVVPTLQELAASNDEIKKFAAKTDPLYQNVNIAAQENKLIFSGSSGRYFGAFREAINHAYNGGQGWRLSLQSMCVGRECSKGGFLQGTFTVNRLKVQR